LSRTPDIQPPAVDSDLFRKACSKFATGVVIATAIDSNGNPCGITVNSFTSVSAVPPLVLFCIDYRASLLTYFRTSSYFGINVLSASQQHISNRFAQREPDRFEDLHWSAGSTGVPLIAGALATMECAVNQIVEAGDHAVLFGEVKAAQYRDGDPLLYFSSRYAEFNAED